MKLKLVCLLAFFLYLPSLSNYFSHDDFFNLQLAKAGSLTEVAKFFDPIHAPDRVGSYRPLTTQTYFLVSYFFNYSPTPLHVIAFVVFFADIFLVYKLTGMVLGQKKSALTATFLYAVSATHFAHLYWPSIFQETGLIFFFLSSVILFLKQRYWWSFVAMIGGFMSKETAIMIPAVITVIIFLNKAWRELPKLIPFYLAVGIFLFVHIFYFGLPPGDVYKLDFSLKIFNTLGWYVLWSFNLPELFVDFVGPGLRVNPNLFLFYGREVVTIFLFFLATIACLIPTLKRIDKKIGLLALGWFLATLLPVIFLPWHKFTYELGVPLVGVVLLLGSILKNKAVLFFCLFWLATSFFTLELTRKTHWITLGPQIALRVKNYFDANHGLQRNIVFYDTVADKTLPWSPANEVKINLSDQDFFTVYYPNQYFASYEPRRPEGDKPDVTYIPARQFLGY